MEEKAQEQFNSALQVYQKVFKRAAADQLFLIFLEIINWRGQNDNLTDLDQGRYEESKEGTRG